MFPDRALTRLHQMVRQREVLRASFRDVFEQLAAGATDADLEAWAEGSLDLAFVNAGPASLLAFWRASIEQGEALGLRTMGAIARAMADVCRHAGSEATLVSLHAIGPAARLLRTRSELALWSLGLVRLAREAPEAVVKVASRTETILQSCDGAAFAAFIATGLKVAGPDRARRRAFFALEDPAARLGLERAGGAVLFSQVECMLTTFATALWGRQPIVRGVGATVGQPPPRRISIAGGVVRVPQVLRAVPAHNAALLFRAGVAHASAHLALSPARFAVGSLKPQQIVLIGLIEDARVEELAMQRYPGLRHLWSPFHVAEPAGVSTAAALLARLARALFDPDYRDDDGFVVKGRALFAAEAGRLHDPLLSRRIGGVLGNDLGQMRVQFDARTHIIEPPYRDDGLGLWDFPDQPENAPDATDLVVESARIEHSYEPEQNECQQVTQKSQATARAREADANERGIVVATYPEWDRAAATERPDWTTVRDIPVPIGDPRRIETALDAAPTLRANIHRLVRGTRIGRHERLKRRLDGPELDVDAALEAAIAYRARQPPDARVYRTSGRQNRDLAVLVLLDASESTRDRAEGACVLDLERLAVAALCEALSRLGDPFALRTFASAGRDDVRIARIKDFEEPYDATAKARLAAVRPGLSTRLGAALRHAGSEIATVRSHRKLVLVLTDGEPSDVDVTDPLDLVEDARRATLALKAAGIDVFGVTLDPTGSGSGAIVFGRNNNMPVRRLPDLPLRLADLYFRLARR